MQMRQPPASRDHECIHGAVCFPCFDVLPLVLVYSDHRTLPNKDSRTATVTTPFPPSLDLDMRLYHCLGLVDFLNSDSLQPVRFALGSRSLGVGERTAEKTGESRGADVQRTRHTQGHFWGTAAASVQAVEIGSALQMSTFGLFGFGSEQRFY